MPVLLRETFCLKECRHNFKPHNSRDKALTFCHQTLLTDDILASIERRFAGNEPVKMLLYGDWGVGKTHTLHHICWWLEKYGADFPAKPVVIEIGDITKKTRFNAVVGPFIDVLGISELVKLVHGYLREKANVNRALEESGVATHVASAFGKLLLVPPGETPPQTVLDAVDYLKGVRLGASAAHAGFGQPLSNSTDFYHVLLAIGEMYLRVHGHRIIFMADEAAKLEAVDSDDATLAHWENANKLILDDTNSTIGFVYTVSGRARTLPKALFSPQLQNRLGENAFEMKNLEPADVGGFLRKLVEEFVDKKRVEDLVKRGEIDSAQYDWVDYPFTSQGKEEFVDYFSRSQENAKPRDISHKLNDVAFVAAKQGKRLIDPDSLRAAQM